MRKLVVLSLLAWSAGAQALESYGLNSSGTLVRIDDVSNSQTFVQNIGLTGTFCLAYNPVDQFFYTVSGGTLFRFKPGTTSVAWRSLPFLSNNIHGLAISRNGICWGIESGTGRLWKFGTQSGEVLVGTTGMSPNGLAFGADGSLYVIHGVVDPNLYGIYVVDQNTAECTRVTKGSQPRFDLFALTARPFGSWGLGNFMGYFNTHATVNPITGAFTGSGGSFVSLRGVAYEFDGPFANIMQLGTVTFGRVVSNTPGCLDDREGDPLRVCKFIVPNQTVPPIQFSLITQVPSNPTTMASLINHRVTSAGSFTMSVDFLNPRLNLYENLGNIAVGSNPATSFVVGDVDRHVSNTRMVNMRLSLRPNGPVGAAVFCLEIDQAVVQST
ncbi:MAG: hypothetical protein KF884_07640 [Fimbriimonadaceae bacterium]|nr:hypothetical protein [Fimbriimonadaceae bacterium]QYK57422.1 MAG: hypothetical protein KF884_07640 [Fimbriimonadaceae bacterium]